MSATGLEGYDPWKCTPPFNPDDEREPEEPCEACERQVEELTAELGQRDARLEALEIEVANLRQSDIARLCEAVGRRAPGSWSVTARRGHYIERYGTIDRPQCSISWWPTESGPARYVEARTADEVLALFRAALKENRS